MVVEVIAEDAWWEPFLDSDLAQVQLRPHRGVFPPGIAVLN